MFLPYHRGLDFLEYGHLLEGFKLTWFPQVKARFRPPCSTSVSSIEPRSKDQRYLECMNTFLEKEKQIALFHFSQQRQATEQQGARPKAQICSSKRKNINYILDSRYYTEGMPCHTTTIPPNPDSVSSEHQ
jgi:hypothetical protein